MTHDSQRLYNDKKSQIIERFTVNFMEELYLKDPASHAIINMLIRDAHPYEIIESLIIERLKLLDQIKYYTMCLNPNLAKSNKNPL